MKPGRKPLRRTRLKSRSEKMAKRMKEYGPLRASYLESHPFCEARIECNGDRSVDVHHVRPRSRGKDSLLDTSVFRAVCRRCHSAIHERPAEARKLGLLASAAVSEIRIRRTDDHNPE